MTTDNALASPAEGMVAEPDDEYNIHQWIDAFRKLRTAYANIYAENGRLKEEFEIVCKVKDMSITNNFAKRQAAEIALAELRGRAEGVPERIRAVADEIYPYCQEDLGPDELWNRLWGKLRGIANDLEAK